MENISMQEIVNSHMSTPAAAVCMFVDFDNLWKDWAEHIREHGYTNDYWDAFEKVVRRYDGVEFNHPKYRMSVAVDNTGEAGKPRLH